MDKHTILFLAANPFGSDLLALDQEAHAIQAELERCGHRDRFALVTRWAVQPHDLLRELRRLRPTVVHFSGHGGRRVVGETRSGGIRYRDLSASDDAGSPGGLYFQAADGRPQRVSTRALQDTFGAAGSSVQVVVLNACSSIDQSDALLAHVGCVVGMRGAIRDDAARSFSIGFYGGLGERASVAAAYRQGCAAISLDGIPNEDRPQLSVRDGLDAEKLVLAADGAMLADELLKRLSRLLPAQFEAVLFRSRAPVGDFSGTNAPQSIRATELIRYFESRNQLEQLVRAIHDTDPR